MATIETKRRLASAGLFALPLVLVQLTATLIGQGEPAQVSATPAAAPMMPESVAAATEQNATADEDAAALHMEHLLTQPFGPAPLFFDRRGADEPRPLPTEPEALPPPDFTVQAIMSSSRGATALIDGKACRVGDELAGTGWRIVDIDPVSRSVTITDDESDRTETRSVNTSR